MCVSTRPGATKRPPRSIDGASAASLGATAARRPRSMPISTRRSSERPNAWAFFRIRSMAGASRGSAHPLRHGDRLGGGKPVDQRRRRVAQHDAVAVRGGQEPLRDHGVDEGEEGAVIALDVEQAYRLVDVAELVE